MSIICSTVMARFIAEGTATSSRREVTITENIYDNGVVRFVLDDSHNPREHELGDGFIILPLAISYATSMIRDQLEGKR